MPRYEVQENIPYGFEIADTHAVPQRVFVVGLTSEQARDIAQELNTPAKSVFILVGKDESDILAIHRTEAGADAHRLNYVMPSWIQVESYDLED